MAETRANPGLFNFQNLMNEFYKYDTKDDPDAAAMKNAFQGNAIQSVFDTQQAKELAYANQEIASNAMNQASNLEQRNMAQIMKNEFAYGMTKMGQEYDFQSRFAVDEANRTLNQTAMQGDVDMNKLSNQASESRKTSLGDSYTNKGIGTIEAESDQERKTKIGENSTYINKGTIGAAAEEERATNTAKLLGDIGQIYVDEDKGRLGAAGKEERLTLGTKGSEERSTLGTKGIEERSTLGTKGTEERSTLNTKGKEERLTEETKGDESRKSISLTSDEGREDKRLEARLKAKERSDQNDYARNLAGKF